MVAVTRSGPPPERINIVLDAAMHTPLPRWVDAVEKSSFGCTRDFRVKMCGTSLSEGDPPASEGANDGPRFSDWHESIYQTIDHPGDEFASAKKPALRARLV